jgi:hypothetical protein
MASLALLAETREAIKIAGDLRVAGISSNEQTGET